MNEDAKDRIKDALPIELIVGEHVALKPAGRGDLKGLCPFHEEKTPSFIVHADRGFYYCFGCHARGDIFDFVQHTHGIDFLEALRLLADRAGVTLDTQPKHDHRKRDLYDLNALALTYYKEALLAHAPARAYLDTRHVTPDTLTTFELGYAPDAWDGLLTRATTAGATPTDLVNAGLVIENEQGRRYDRFRNRIMFPIRDHLGRLAGFSGRSLDGSEPKYLNTPETAIFSKRTLLYGLAINKEQVRATHSAVVVEGQMDVVALHQHGLRVAVAAMGSTLTPQHAALLDRLGVEHVYLAYDADEAGRRATLTGLNQSFGRRFLVRAATIPGGQDPDEYVTQHGLAAFRRTLQQGVSAPAFQLDALLSKHDTSTDAGRAALLNDALPALQPRGLYDPAAAEMRRLIMERLDVHPARLDAWLAQNKPKPIDLTQARGLSATPLDHAARRQLDIITLALQAPDTLLAALDDIEWSLPTDGSAAILSDFLFIARDANGNVTRILEAYKDRGEMGARVFERALNSDYQLNGDVPNLLSRALSRLREEALSREHAAARARLATIAQALRDGTATPEQTAAYQAERAELLGLLSARDAERRTRLT